MGRTLNSKKYKTKRYRRDLDQVYNDDMASDQSIQKLEKQEIDEYKPGLGQYYCIQCVKYFESQAAVKSHISTKRHKRRLKEIKEIPYTGDEADAAAGHSVGKYLQRKEEYTNKLEVPKIKSMLTPQNKASVEASFAETTNTEGDAMMEDNN